MGVAIEVRLGCEQRAVFSTNIGSVVVVVVVVVVCGGVS